MFYRTGEKKCNRQTDEKDALSWCAPISYLHQPEDSGSWGRQPSELCSCSDHDESFFGPQGAVPPAICHTRRTFRLKTWLQKPKPWRQSELIFTNSAINFIKTFWFMWSILVLKSMSKYRKKTMRYGTAYSITYSWNLSDCLPFRWNEWLLG